MSPSTQGRHRAGLATLGVALLAVFLTAATGCGTQPGTPTPGKTSDNPSNNTPDKLPKVKVTALNRVNLASLASATAEDEAVEAIPEDDLDDVDEGAVTEYRSDNVKARTSNPRPADAPQTTFVAGAGSRTPPDPTIAAGRKAVVQVANSKYGRIAIFDRAQTEAAPIARRIADVVGHSGERTSDPRVLYEAATGWFWVSILVLHFDDTGKKFTDSVVAMAHTVGADDPTGDWQPFDIAAGKELLDQPQLAVGARQIVVSWSPNGASANKHVFLARSVVDQVGGPQEVEGLEGDSDAAFLALARQPDSPDPVVGVAHKRGSDQLSVWTFTSVITNGQTGVATASAAVTIGRTHRPPKARQPNDARPLWTDDDRITSVYRTDDGRIWAVGNDACKLADDSEPRSCLRVIELKVNSPTEVEVIQDFDIGQGNTDLMYPAIVEVPGSRDILIAHEVSSASQSLTAGITWIPSGRSAPEVPGIDYALGAGPLDKVGYDNRLGDYLGVDLDPTDPNVVWVVGQYGTNQLDRYAVEVTSFTFPLA